MSEKILEKIETRDEDARKEIEGLLEKNDYEICPYVVRIYDFIGIGSTDGKKKIAAHCLYSGTVHQPEKTCLGDFNKCKKYRELQQFEEPNRK